MRLGPCLVQKLAESVQVSLGLVGLVDEADDSRRECRALFIGVPVMADGGMVVASPDCDVAEHDVRPRAVTVVAQGFVRVLDRLLFAVAVGNRLQGVFPSSQ